jgi:hypothetical protein
MIRSGFVFGAALLFLSFNTLAADKWPASVDQYANLLQQARSRKSSLEAAFNKGMDAIHALADSLSQDESEIDAIWLKKLRAKMEGFDLFPNTETAVANPNIEFFKALAKKNGNAGDVAYFEILKQAEPDGRWPAYIQQLTDISGCTVFNGTLTRLHRGWSEFQKHYPHAFVKDARDWIFRIESELTETHCFCDDKKEPILTELQAFVRSNPKASISSKINKRIEALQTGKVPIPGCKNQG